MESSEKDVVTDVPLKPKGKWSWVINALTFGSWNKYTAKERWLIVKYWSISSWATRGEYLIGSWLWTKLSPWLVPIAKSVWGKLTFALVALKEAV